MRTIELLDQLEPMGFGHKAFRALHHYQETSFTSINAHRNYIRRQNILAFQPGTKNFAVEQRLELVLALYIAGKFTNPDAFLPLAMAAVAQLPIDVQVMERV